MSPLFLILENYFLCNIQRSPEGNHLNMDFFSHVPIRLPFGPDFSKVEACLPGTNSTMS